MLVIHLPTRHSTIRRPCSARRFIEQPDRSERYRILLDVMREDGLEVHDEGYVAFLQTVHERWSANPGYGPEVIPKRAPDAPDAPQTHRAPRRARLVFELHILPHRGGDLAVRSCQRTIRGPCGRQALGVETFGLRALPSPGPSCLSGPDERRMLPEQCGDRRPPSYEILRQSRHRRYRRASRQRNAVHLLRACRRSVLLHPYRSPAVRTLRGIRAGSRPSRARSRV